MKPIQQTDPLVPDSILRRFAVGSFWSAAGVATASILRFLAWVLVARWLTAGEYGTLGMIQSTVGLFGSVAGFGMGLTATRHVAQYCRTDPARAGKLIALSGAVAWITSGTMAVLMVVTAPWLATHTLAAPQTAGLLRIGSLLLLFGAVSGAQTGALSGYEAFRTVAIVNSISGLLAFPLMTGGVMMGGIEGAVWGLVASQAAAWLLNAVALHRENRLAGVSVSLVGCWDERNVLTGFSMPSVMSGIVFGAVTWLSQAILVNQAHGYEALGVFNAAIRVKQLPESLLTMLMVPLLPMLSDFHGRRDGRSYSHTVRIALSISIGLVVSAALLQTAVPWLTLWPYGSEYAGHRRLVQWLMLHGTVIGLISPFGSMVTSTGRMWFGFAYSITWNACFLALSLWLVPAYGAEGLAAAQALSHLATSLPFFGYVFVHDRDMIRDVPFLRLSAVVLLLYGCCLVTEHFLGGGLVSTLLGCIVAVSVLGCAGAAAARLLFGRTGWLLR